MTKPQPFTDLIAVEALGDGAYHATIDPIWTIGPKVHGGAMMAICAAAAKETGTDTAGLAPIALSANYIHAPNPGKVQLTATIRRRGRKVSLVDVELAQDNQTALTCAVTLGRLDATPPRYVEPSAAAEMPAQPPGDAISVSPDHPIGQVIHVAQGCELLMDPVTTLFLEGKQGPPVNRMWLRPLPADERDPDTAALFAIMAADISPPVPMNRGIFGWTPTVQLTTYLRHPPVPGWMRVMASSTVLGDNWFEEDHVILDTAGNVVVQSRQLAMLPQQTWAPGPA